MPDGFPIMQYSGISSFFYFKPRKWSVFGLFFKYAFLKLVTELGFQEVQSFRESQKFLKVLGGSRHNSRNYKNMIFIRSEGRST
jgi:hypothetical protein